MRSSIWRRSRLGFLSFLVNSCPPLYNPSPSSQTHHKHHEALRLHPGLLAVPTKTLQPRATEICGQWYTVETSTYIVYQDLWGESYATSGSQCTTVTGIVSGYLDLVVDQLDVGGCHIAGQVVRQRRDDHHV